MKSILSIDPMRTIRSAAVCFVVLVGGADVVVKTLATNGVFEKEIQQVSLMGSEKKSSGALRGAG